MNHDLVSLMGPMIQKGTNQRKCPQEQQKCAEWALTTNLGYNLLSLSLSHHCSDLSLSFSPSMSGLVSSNLTIRNVFKTR